MNLLIHLLKTEMLETKGVLPIQSITKGARDHVSKITESTTFSPHIDASLFKTELRGRSVMDLVTTRRKVFV